MKQLLLIAMAALAFGLAGCKKVTPVTQETFKDGERVTYPFTIFRGACGDELSEVTVVNETNGEKVQCPAYKGRYKAWTRLNFGTNAVTVTGGKSSVSFKLFYERANTDYVYYPYYMVDSTGDRKYLSNLGENDPQEKDPELWLKKFRTSLEILQGYLADCMVRRGYERKTITFDLCKDGQINVQVVTSKYSRAEIASWKRPNGEFEEGKLYDEFVRAIGREGKGMRRVTGLPNTQSIVDGRLTGNTALGGQSLAQFGANGLYGWPSSIQDIVPAFMNATPIAGPNNDSVGRNVQWGHVATTLGAYMHEIGHSMWLPHIEGPGIMARAGDHINRIFTFMEAPTARCATNRVFREEEEVYWNKPECHWLNLVAHMNEVRGRVPEDGPKVSLEKDRDTVVLSSPYGIAMYSVSDPTFVVSYSNCVYFTKETYQKEVRLSLKECLAKVGMKSVMLDTFDAYGNGLSVVLSESIPAASERAYDFGTFELGNVQEQQNVLINGSSTKGVIVNDEKEGRVLSVWDSDPCVQTPFSLEPEEGAKPRSLEFKVRLKPVPGSTYFDVKDICGESLFYAHVDENGVFELNSGFSKKVLKDKVESEWQDWTFSINPAKGLITKIAIDGKSYVLSNFRVGGNGLAEIVWLKSPGQIPTLFKSVSGAYSK